MLVDVLGFTIVIPLLALYAKRFGASNLVATSIVSVYAVCSLISTPIIGNLSDRFGRKPLLLIGSIGMTITLALVAYAFSTAGLDAAGKLVLSPSMGILALVSANAYAALFNLSWGPVMWVMLGEMFPNQMRGSALAVSGLAQWMTNLAISVSFPSLAVSPGLAVTYTGYAIAAGVSFFFVKAMINETRGRELEDMEG